MDYEKIYKGKPTIRERYKQIANSEWFKKTHEGMSVSEEPDDSYCQENCKGFKETGKCFADGDCKAKREAKTVDKVEPKFHEGDWIVYKNDICQIVKREKGCNKLVTTFGIEKELVNERNLSTARLWTIADAKDGDVLSFKNNGGCIICKCPTNDKTYSYCRYENNCFIYKEKWGWRTESLVPTTKEQREQLFKAMHEAGYEWDEANKKLTKKIGNVKKIRNDSLNCQNVLLNWSEEDDKIFNKIINSLLGAKNVDCAEYNIMYNWLISIKERMQ